MRRTTERGKRKEDRKGSKAGNGACFAKSRQGRDKQSSNQTIIPANKVDGCD